MDILFYYCTEAAVGLSLAALKMAVLTIEQQLLAAAAAATSFDSAV